jgi:hypothetical protein
MDGESTLSNSVTKVAGARLVHERLQIQTNALLILGIIAESRYAPIITPQTDYLSFSGLGLAFDAQTIIETIELFFPK